MTDTDQLPRKLVPGVWTPLPQSRYATEYEHHLDNALDWAGYERRIVTASVFPRGDAAVQVRDFTFVLVIRNQIETKTTGIVRSLSPHRMKDVLLNTLARIEHRLTKWQTFRFKLYVWWTQLTGGFFHG